jgi:hypothetical protein
MKNGVKNIQAVGYNGVSTIIQQQDSGLTLTENSHCLISSGVDII